MARRGQVLAAVGVVVLAVGMAVLPMLVALGGAPGAVARTAVGLGSLAAVWGGVKAAAVVLGAAEYARRPRRTDIAASCD